MARSLLWYQGQGKLQGSRSNNYEGQIFQKMAGFGGTSVSQTHLVDLEF